MTIRGNDWPIDPASTSGTELATVLNRMVDALDSTNHTDNTGDRPDYAVKGTLWLDGDVSEQNLGLKMFTGAADALLFDINDQTGAVSHKWRKVELQDASGDYGDGQTTFNAYIQQNGGATQMYCSDGAGVASIRSWTSSLWGLNVDGKLNVGFSETTNANCMSVVPRDEGGVRFYTTDSEGVSSKNLFMTPGKLSGGVYQTDESLSCWMYGTASSFATVDGSSTNGRTGFYCGNPLGDYWAAIGNDGGNNGANTMTLQINRNASNSNFSKYSVGGAVRSRISASGQVYGTGPYVDLSDGQTKSIDEHLDISPQQVVMGLNVRKYTRHTGGGPEYGFVADEVQAVLPSAVVSFEGESYKEDERRNRASLYENMTGEEATPSIMSEIAALDAPELLGLQKDQINAVLLAHVQDLTRRLEALEGA